MLLVLLAVIGRFFTPHDPNAQSLSHSLEGPSGSYWFGTDRFGRDIFSRLLEGTGLSLFAALQAVVVSVALGIPIGLLAGYAGGWIDAIASRVGDALLSIPGLVLAFGIVGVLGPSLRNAMIAIGVILAPSFFRISRATAANLRHETFILAARSVGCSDRRLLTRHILPNTAGPLLVQLSFAASLAIVGEASLSFLGLGVQQPQASIGSMLAGGYDTINNTVWPMVPPAAMIMVVVLSLFFVGDALEEATARAGATGESRA
jgi:peptide/nickel transport system permease protein